MAHARTRGEPFAVSDPLAESTRDIAGRTGSDPAALVAGMLQLESVFGTDLRDDHRVMDRLAGFVAQLRAGPAIQAVETFVSA